MLDMNPGIRARWTAALRSGDYQQGRATLRFEDRFCCLGVLCDLAEKAGVIHAHESHDGAWDYDGEEAFLPTAVMDWAGITDASPYVNVPSTMEDEPTLTTLNDEDQWDFAQIADAIDGGAA